MTNKTVIGLCLVLSLVVSGVVGVFLQNGLQGVAGSLSRGFGAGITPSNALNQQRLISELGAIASSTAGIASYSGSFYIGTLNAVVPVTSTALTTSGASVGDLVIVTLDPTTVTSSYVNAFGRVTGSGTTTIYINSLAASSTNAWSAGSVNYNVRVMPSSTFLAPVGL